MEGEVRARWVSKRGVVSGQAGGEERIRGYRRVGGFNGVQIRGTYRYRGAKGCREASYIGVGGG